MTHPPQQHTPRTWHVAPYQSLPCTAIYYDDNDLTAIYALAPCASHLAPIPHTWLVSPIIPDEARKVSKSGFVGLEPGLEPMSRFAPPPPPPSVTPHTSHSHVHIISPRSTTPIISYTTASYCTPPRKAIQPFLRGARSQAAC